jgi:hypothetical protein
MDLLTHLTKEPLPFAAFLGIEIVSGVPNKIVAEMMVRDELCTRPAMLHGGAVMAFADTLGALGARKPDGWRPYRHNRKQNQLHKCSTRRQSDCRRNDALASRAANDGLANARYNGGW